MSGPALSVYAGPAGDHNNLAMSAVASLGDALGERLGIGVTTVGLPSPAAPAGGARELERCRPALALMADRLENVMAAGQRPISAISRCAVALATIPVVLRHHADAVIVWFDAHADINTPDDTPTGYLGGLALSGALGWWDSGLGSAPAGASAILVGTRDLDPPEQAAVDEGRVVLVPPEPDLGARLADAIAGRPVYVHLDCDVLEPGILATDYHVPGGLPLADLQAAAEACAGAVGLEIAEYEGPGSATPHDVLEALAALL